jgi:AcrR family transcriptional regulator
MDSSCLDGCRYDKCHILNESSNQLDIRREPKVSTPASRQDRDSGARARIVRGAAELIRTKGVSGTGMREVVAFADAPRGSLQHYFPGGKDQLVCEALLWSGHASGALVRQIQQRLVDATPSQLLSELVGWWRHQFLKTGFAAGCPLVAATVDVVADSDAIRIVVGRALDDWQDPLIEALRDMGVPEERSVNLAILILSSLEGAIVLARIRHDVAPLEVIVQELAPVLDGAVIASVADSSAMNGNDGD